MKQNKRLLYAMMELAIVLYLTALAFVFGCAVATAERGYKAYGGEYLIPMLPVLYYAGKRTVKDWLADLQEIRRGNQPLEKEE